MRISKPPEIRKQEIIDTAMRVFYEKGYENTSLEDIAKEMGVVKGLVYRYFSSKQELFSIAMEQYVRECCEPYLEILHNNKKSILERLNRFMRLAQESDINNVSLSFFHKKGHEGLHEQLSIKICKYFIPHFKQELDIACKNGELKIENTQMKAEFILYGQICLWESQTIPVEERFQMVEYYIKKILDIE